MSLVLKALLWQCKSPQWTINDGQYIDFGLKDSKTYLDHKDTDKREYYRKRHWEIKWKII